MKGNPDRRRLMNLTAASAVLASAACTLPGAGPRPIGLDMEGRHCPLTGNQPCSLPPAQARVPRSPHLHLPEGFQEDAELLSAAQCKHRDQHLWGWGIWVGVPGHCPPMSGPMRAQCCSLGPPSQALLAGLMAWGYIHRGPTHVCPQPQPLQGDPTGSSGQPFIGIRHMRQAPVRGSAELFFPMLSKPSSVPRPPPLPRASYLAATLHGLMHLLQEVSLPTAFGVTNGRGVCGFCDEQVGAAFVNPGSSTIEGHSPRWTVHLPQAGGNELDPSPGHSQGPPAGSHHLCKNQAVECHGQHLGVTGNRLCLARGSHGDTGVIAQAPSTSAKVSAFWGWGWGGLHWMRQTRQPTYPRCRSGVML